MSLYRKKPVAIDAVRWTGDPECLRDLPGASGCFDHRIPYVDGALPIVTFEGTMIAHVGDWIIRGVKGEFYPIKDDIFRATYEEVSPPAIVAENKDG